VQLGVQKGNTYVCHAGYIHNQGRLPNSDNKDFTNSGL